MPRESRKTYENAVEINTALASGRAITDNFNPILTFAAFLVGLRINGLSVESERATVSGDVDRWPENRADGEIDAIIGPYAVQHTSIDTLPAGRSRNA